MFYHGRNLDPGLAACLKLEPCVLNCAIITSNLKWKTTRIWGVPDVCVGVNSENWATLKEMTLCYV